MSRSVGALAVGGGGGGGGGELLAAPLDRAVAVDSAHGVGWFRRLYMWIRPLGLVSQVVRVPFKAKSWH